MARFLRFLIIFGAFVSIGNCEFSGNGIRQGKDGFLDGATSMLSSLAKELVTRSATSSQVLSLNLTNLFILFVLKAIIFGAGTFGYGHGGHGRNGENPGQRSLDFDGFLTETEFLMFLGYMKGDLSQDYGCLQRIACEDPQKAQQYAFTGKLFLKGSELFSPSWSPTKYENAISHVDEAINYGMTGENCVEKYRCEVK